MPNYDYECKACGHRFEAFQQMSDPPIKKCPKCGKIQVRRLIGGGLGVIFKGSGFYVTDNRKSSVGSSRGSGNGSSSKEKVTSPEKGGTPSTATSGKEGSNGGDGKSGDKGSSSKKEAVGT